MTLSTSSSDIARPPWRKIWVLALMLSLVIVGGWEVLVRQAGLGPEYSDNRSLWADARHELNNHGDNAIALLGASRMQYAVDVETMSVAFERPVIQLSVEGTSALVLLENLAADPRFRGTVIYSIAPAFSFNSILPRIESGKQREWVQHYLDHHHPCFDHAISPLYPRAWSKTAAPTCKEMAFALNFPSETYFPPV